MEEKDNPKLYEAIEKKRKVKDLSKIERI